MGKVQSHRVSWRNVQRATLGGNNMSSRLQKGLQQETEYWLRQGKLSRFFNGVSDEIINGKRYLLSGDTLAALQESGWIA